jgi:hypothetical protein
MFDWYAEHLVIQARQREMAGAAHFGWMLAEARTSRSALPGQREGVGNLRYKVGAALILLGRTLQGVSSSVCAGC